MSDVQWPEVAILCITYNRYKECVQVLDALQKHLSYPADKLRVVVSDDHTGGLYLSQIRRNKRFQVWGNGGIQTIETPERSGWGKHVNWALGQIRNLSPNVKYVFQIEDDYVLTHDLDLSVGVALMEEKEQLGMLRYRGTAGCHVVLHQFEADVKAWLPDFDESAGLVPGKLCYLQLDSGSPCIYLYSNGPHLKRLRNTGFHEFYGAYPENIALGDTEESMAHRVRDMMKLPNAPALAILPEWVPMRFEHIGHSWKGTEHDIHG